MSIEEIPGYFSKNDKRNTDSDHQRRYQIWIQNFKKQTKQPKSEIEKNHNWNHPTSHSTQHLACA